jgi:hypothetical protein
VGPNEAAGACYIRSGPVHQKNNMNNTGKTFLLAVSLVGCALPASAIPITFDISGTITNRQIRDFSTGEQTIDTSQSGQTFTARFLVETDALRVSERIEDESAEFLVIRDAGAILGVQASLTIGGTPVDVTRFPVDASNVQFTDSNGLQEVCDEFGCFSTIAPDSWLVGVRSGTSSPPGGAAQRSSFFFSVQELFDPAILGSGTTWLDFSQSTSIDLLATLPMGPFSATSLLRWTEDIDSVRTTTGFNVTSFSRTVNSVPEPGALGLLAAGLFGVFAARRRRQTSRA